MNWGWFICHKISRVLQSCTSFFTFRTKILHCTSHNFQKRACPPKSLLPKVYGRLTDRIWSPSTDFGRPKHSQNCPAANFLMLFDYSFARTKQQRHLSATTQLCRLYSMCSTQADCNTQWNNTSWNCSVESAGSSWLFVDNALSVHCSLTLCIDHQSNRVDILFEMWLVIIGQSPTNEKRSLHVPYSVLLQKKIIIKWLKEHRNKFLSNKRKVARYISFMFQGRRY